MTNENRLIDANALMDEFRRYMVERYDREKCVSEENCKTCDKSCLWRKKVSAAPTVDAVEVVHGRWIELYMGELKCPICDEKVMCVGWLTNGKYNYCHNCGANVNRRTLRCDYCGTEYESPNDRIKIVVDRPGVHKIRCETRVDMTQMRYSPERAKEYVLSDMRQQIADGLLAYMKMTTSESHDPLNYCQIIRGEVRVLDPSFDH